MTWFADKRLLVPFDFSEASIKAIDEALEMASAANLVSVLHVSPDLNVSAPEVVWEALSDETRRKNIEDSFHKVVLGEKYKDVLFEVEFGDAGEGIAEYAAENKVDVIVMPSHGRTGLKRLLLGSVAERVARLAHCPVLILRYKSET